MNGTSVDAIATASGIVIIVAGFVASLIYCTRKEKDWKVIISVPIVIAVLIGVAYYGFGGSRTVKSLVTSVSSTPKNTLDRYCKYYLAGDYETIYNDLFSINSPVRKGITSAEAAAHGTCQWTL